ncbi:MAG: filamentous hemagglutinin N-terminal domain-containing protein [Nitrospirae bacterium]|nr:filamentous hemagglutinin N-terminal domain-containing protein [Magnetococcales bacterium]
MRQSPTTPTKPHRTSARPQALVLAAFIAGLSGSAFALPENGSIQGGSAQIHNDAAGIKIDQSSERAIIDWGRFDIGSGERVDIRQPSQGSWLLNRVQSGLPSQIHGQLNANGHVLISNPQGIHFGSGARVDVGGMMATTHSIDGKNFLDGRLSLSQSSESTSSRIENHGVIKVREGSSIVLAAPEVVNAGTLQANDGRVVLSAQPAHLLRLDDYPLLGFALDDNQAVAVTDHGKDAASVAMQSTLAMHGVEVAQGASVQGGRIVLHGGQGAVRVDGRLDARGGNGASSGGNIDVLGRTVSVGSHAQLDASADRGGGRIRIGGDFQGKNPTVDNAQTTRIDPGARIRADALDHGDGGRVIVWADGTTRFDGDISAQGGMRGGDGGFAEVSGKSALRVRGRVTTAAPKGKVGTVLFDPTNLTISSTGTASDLIGVENSDGSAQEYARNEDENTNGSVDDVTMTASAVQNAMNTNHVILYASSAITVNEAITHSGNNNLTLNAGSSIDVNQPITLGSGSINLTSGTTLSIVAALTANGAGAINLNSGGAMSLGANVKSAGGAITFIASSSSITTNSSTEVTTSGASVTMIGGGNLSLGSAISGADVTLESSGGTLTGTSSGSITGSGAVTLKASGANGTINNAATITSTGSGALTLEATGSGSSISNSGTLTSASGAITLKATQSSGSVSNSGTINANADNDITLEASGSGGSITNTGVLASSSGAIAFKTNHASGGNITNSGALKVNGSDADNDTITFTANGSGVSITNTGTLTSSKGAISLKAESSGATITARGVISSGGAVTVTAAGGLSVTEAITASGAINLNTSGTNSALSVISSLTGGSSVNLTASGSGGSISQTGSIDTSGNNGAINLTASGSGGSITSGTLTSGSGSVTMTADGATTLGNTVTGKDITLTSSNGAITTNGSITGSGSITLSGTSLQANADMTTSGTDITLTGDLTLSSNRAISTGSGAGAITFNSAIKGSGAPTLTLTAGTGDITFNNTLGNSDNPLGGLNITSAKQVTLKNAATINGDATLTTEDFALAAALSASNITLNTVNATTGIVLGDANGSSLTIDIAEMNLLTTTGTVSIGSSNHSGGIVVGNLYGSSGSSTPLPSYHLTLATTGNLQLTGAINMDGNFTFSGPGTAQVKRTGKADNQLDGSYKNGDDLKYNIISQNSAHNITFNSSLDIYELGSSQNQITDTPYTAIFDAKGGNIDLNGRVRMPLTANGDGSAPYTYDNASQSMSCDDCKSIYPNQTSTRFVNQRLDLRAGSSNPATSSTTGGTVTMKDGHLFNLLVTGTGQTLGGTLWRSWWNNKTAKDEKGQAAADNILTEPAPHNPRQPGFTFNNYLVVGDHPVTPLDNVPMLDVKVRVEKPSTNQRVLDTAKYPQLYDAMETYLSRKEQSFPLADTPKKKQQDSKNGNQGSNQKSEEKRRNLILVLGVSSTPKFKLMAELTGVITELESLNTELEAWKGEDGEIVSIPVKGAHNPSKVEIIEAFNTLRRKARENDTVLIYYSGHGIMHQREGQAERDYFWVPNNAEYDWGTEVSYLISGDDLSRLLIGENGLDPINAKRLLMIVDTCVPNLKTMRPIETTPRYTFATFPDADGNANRPLHVALLTAGPDQSSTGGISYLVSAWLAGDRPDSHANLKFQNQEPPKKENQEPPKKEDNRLSVGRLLAFLNRFQPDPKPPGAWYSGESGLFIDYYNGYFSALTVPYVDLHGTGTGHISGDDFVLTKPEEDKNQRKIKND